MTNLSNVVTTNKVVSVLASALVGAAIAVPLALSGVQSVQADPVTTQAGNIDACSISKPVSVDVSRVLADTAVTTATNTQGGGLGQGGLVTLTPGVNATVGVNADVHHVFDVNVGDVNVLNHLLNGNTVNVPVNVPVNANVLNGNTAQLPVAL